MGRKDPFLPAFGYCHVRTRQSGAAAAILQPWWERREWQRSWTGALPSLSSSVYHSLSLKCPALSEATIYPPQALNDSCTLTLFYSKNLVVPKVLPLILSYLFPGNQSWFSINCSTPAYLEIIYSLKSTGFSLLSASTGQIINPRLTHFPDGLFSCKIPDTAFDWLHCKSQKSILANL